MSRTRWAEKGKEFIGEAISSKNPVVKNKLMQVGKVAGKEALVAGATAASFVALDAAFSDKSDSAAFDDVRKSSSNPISDQALAIKMARVWKYRIESGDKAGTVRAMRNLGVIESSDSLAEIVRKIQAVDQWHNEMMFSLVENVN